MVELGERNQLWVPMEARCWPEWNTTAFNAETKLALYQGTTLVGPLNAGMTRALAPEVCFLKGTSFSPRVSGCKQGRL